MRIRDLYDPPALKDHAPVVPWTADGVTASSKTTDEGCEITVTGKDSSWLYPPETRPDGLKNVVWQKKDGSYLIGIYNLTVPRNAGLPLVFAAEGHPY